jgi:ATP-dependent DNA helicase RecQ
MWDGITLVVSPLIALMKNQIDFLRSRGISAARMDSSLTQEEAGAANDQLRSGELMQREYRDAMIRVSLRDSSAA